jgi:hypothetical protein
LTSTPPGLPSLQVFRQQVVQPGAAGQQRQRQRLQAAAGRELLLEERDASRHLQLGRTKDWRYVTINSNSKLSCEVGGRCGSSPEAGARAAMWWCLAAGRRPLCDTSRRRSC